MFGLALGRLAGCGLSAELPRGFGGCAMGANLEPPREHQVAVGGVSWLA